MATSAAAFRVGGQTRITFARLDATMPDPSTTDVAIHPLADGSIRVVSPAGPEAVLDRFMVFDLLFKERVRRAVRKCLIDWEREQGGNRCER